MTLPSIKNVAYLATAKPTAGGIQYAYPIYLSSDNLLLETGADLLAEDGQILLLETQSGASGVGGKLLLPIGGRILLT